MCTCLRCHNSTRACRMYTRCIVGDHEVCRTSLSNSYSVLWLLLVLFVGYAGFVVDAAASTQPTPDAMPLIVQHALEQGHHVRLSTTENPFWFRTPTAEEAGTHAGTNVFSWSGTLKPTMTTVMEAVLHGACIKPDGSRALFVDVGMNIGWFTVMAAAYGCRVHGFEPTPAAFAYANYSVHLNGFQDLVTLHNVAISTEPGTLTMMTGNQDTWGCASGASHAHKLPVGGRTSFTVPSIRLDSVVNEDLLVLKIDVEGMEGQVLESSGDLTYDHNISAVFMEISAPNDVSEALDESTMTQVEFIHRMQNHRNQGPSLLFTFNDAYTDLHETWQKGDKDLWRRIVRVFDASAMLDLTRVINTYEDIIIFDMETFNRLCHVINPPLNCLEATLMGVDSKGQLDGRTWAGYQERLREWRQSPW